jgi:hypothetical protein
MWKKTRRWNLATLLLTAFSWFGLGIWYGFGYCPCTDWHWMVRRKLGYVDMPNSYIAFLVEKLTGLHFKASVVDAWTAILFFTALIISFYLNFRNFKRKPIAT